MHLVAYIVVLALCLDATASGGIPLNMADKSAAYLFTQSAATDDAAIADIKRAQETTGDFINVWNQAMNTLPTVEITPGLKKEHMVAIRAYTADSKFYSLFNEEMREYGESDEKYKNNFHFKSFHYLLSVALDKLKATLTTKSVTYRGVGLLFQPNKQSVRLGQFASASLAMSVAVGFTDRNKDTNTLFEIHTNYGVQIDKISYFSKQQEVLIPPQEVFKVEKVEDWIEGKKKLGRRIVLVAERCEGIPVSVKVVNGVFEVKRINNNSKRCNLL